MSQRRFFRGPVCGVGGCKSQRYYRADGLTYCHHHHQAHGVVEYELDDEETLAAGLGSRRKRGPIHSSSQNTTSTTLFHGKSGYAVFIQAFQLILRFQADVITQRLDIPEFPSVLKELWTLFLLAQDTNDKLPDVEEELAHDMDETLPDTSSQGTNGQLSDTEEESSNEEEGEKYVNARYIMHRPVLLHSIALLYLTFILLRTPITIHELREWMLTGELPYMRALSCIPPDHLSHLEPGYREALQPQILPQTTRIWKWTQQTALFLRLTSRVEFPVLNYRPILYNMVRDLFLPVDVYNAVDERIDCLDLHILTNQRKSMRYMPPEIRVLGLALVITKLFYNLDGVKRCPEIPSEPPNRAPDQIVWRKTIRTVISQLEGVDLLAKTVPSEALSMNTSTIDQYLEWFAKTWLPKESTLLKPISTTPLGILNMFPLVPRGAQSSGHENIKQPEMDMLTATRSLTDHPAPRLPRAVTRPGELYSITASTRPNTSDDLLDDLIELASLRCSLPDNDIRKCMQHIEHTLARQSREIDEEKKLMLRRQQTEISANKDLVQRMNALDEPDAVDSQVHDESQATHSSTGSEFELDGSADSNG